MEYLMELKNKSDRTKLDHALLQLFYIADTDDTKSIMLAHDGANELYTLLQTIKEQDTLIDKLESLLIEKGLSDEMGQI